MGDNLFKQLDLAIYALSGTHWWQHPALQLILGAGLAGIVFIIIVLRRKRVRKTAPTEEQALLEILYQSAGLWQQKKINSADVLLTLTALIKRYTSLIIKDKAVDGMTDQEWLLQVKKIPVFEQVHDECLRLAESLSYYKFCKTSLSQEQVQLLYELVYQIIAKTSSGAVAATSGLFKSSIKSAKT